MSEVYVNILSRPRRDEEQRAVVGPFPRITEVLALTSLEEKPSNMLALSGEESATILPSLDASPLLKALGQSKLDRVTFLVDVNSDSYNRGLGVSIRRSQDFAVEDELESNADHYEYGGGGKLGGPAALGGDGWF